MKHFLLENALALLGPQTIVVNSGHAVRCRSATQQAIALRCEIAAQRLVAVLRFRTAISF